MKRLFTLLFVTVVIFSCTKDINNRDSYLKKVQHALKDSLGQKDYDQLMIEGAISFKDNNDQRSYLRIPFRGQNFATDFILLETSEVGAINRGKIVHIEEETKPESIGTLVKKSFNGNITIESLDRARQLASPITNGYIEALHQKDRLAKTSIVPAVTELPEVIVVCSYRNEYNYSYAGWLMMQSLFYDSMTSNNLTSYTYMYGGDYGGGGGGTGDGGLTYNDGYIDDRVMLEDPLISVDVETQDLNPAIDLQKYINCFNAIPDAGSTCSIEIFADIPVDSDPMKLFNTESQSPGHTFIQLKKSNGSQSAIQNIGFYPETNYKSIMTTAPVPGKLVDNGVHEFNASIVMNVSPDNFKSILTEIQYLGGFIKYDIDEYNCTDFALDVFNKVRSDKLQIPTYNIPGGINAGGTRTPQGLYNKLWQMKYSGSAEASSITIGNFKNWVAQSNGPCY